MQFMNQTCDFINKKYIMRFYKIKTMSQCTRHFFFLWPWINSTRYQFKESSILPGIDTWCAENVRISEHFGSIDKGHIGT